MKNYPAFPTIYDDTWGEQGVYTFGITTENGMTMLEFFAAHAMGGVLAEWNLSDFQKDAPRIAEISFSLAEAMCEEAEKRRKNA